MKTCCLRLLLLAGLMLLAAPVVRAEPTPAPPSGPPEKIKIAVLDLQSNGVPAELASTMTSVVASELARLDVFSVISQQEIRALLSRDALAQLTGCEAGASCQTDVGSALGVRYVVSGNVGAVGEQHTLNLALTDTEKASVAGRESVQVKQTAALLDAASRATKSLVAKVLKDRQGVLFVNCAERGASVKIDGAVVGVTPLPRQTVSWGPHLLEVEKKGFITAMEDISMSTNGVLDKTVSLIPSPDFLNDYESKARGMRIGAGVLTGATALAIGAAVYFQVEQSKESSTFNSLRTKYEAETVPSQTDFDALAKVRSTALQELTYTYVFVGVAVACAAGATYFWAAGGDPDRYSRYRAATSLNLVPADDGTRLAVSFFRQGIVSGTFDLR